MRTVFKSLAPNRCTIAHDAEYLFSDGPVVERDTDEYWAPSEGGYVRYVTFAKPGTLGRQVCEGLGYQGNTLRWNPSNGPLVNLIRAEYNKQKRNRKFYDTF